MNELHAYSGAFYDYTFEISLRSARALIGRLAPLLQPESVLDVGCARGQWLQAWREAGVGEVQGVDGPYVDPATLAIPRDSFAAMNLAEPFALGRRFALVQSLEVAEHLPRAAAARFVRSLAAHGDVVMFSAAVVGQGGEHHVNEQPLEYWRRLFADTGYAPFDAVRPLVSGNQEVQPWFRYNTVLYANDRGTEALPPALRAARVPERTRLRDGGDLKWRFRRAMVACLPRPVVDSMARATATRAARRAGAT